MVKKFHKQKSVFLYIEGGGDQAALRDELRRGFAEFFRKAAIDRLPKIIAGGGRNRTYDLYQIAVRQGKTCLLLVDSEDLVEENGESPWKHFLKRKGDEHWTKPLSAADNDVHLMVCCMESWFLADRETLKNYFGQGFNEKSLRHEKNLIESIPKQDVLDGLKKATKNCKTKFVYGKSEHSFALIALIDPQKIEKASPWAEKLLKKLREGNANKVYDTQ